MEVPRPEDTLQPAGQTGGSATPGGRSRGDGGAGEQGSRTCGGSIVVFKPWVKGRVSGEREGDVGF